MKNQMFKKHVDDVKFFNFCYVVQMNQKLFEIIIEKTIDIQIENFSLFDVQFVKIFDVFQIIENNIKHFLFCIFESFYQL